MENEMKDLINKIVDMLESVDLSRSLQLTKLLDGVHEYTLKYGDSDETFIFEDIDDAYEHIRNRTREKQAEIVLKIFQERGFLDGFN